MKVLFVDDNKSILSAFRRNLRKRYDVTVSESGEEAVDTLAMKGPFGVVVSDMKMPGMNGVEFLEKAAEVAPATVRIMLTGNADQETPIEAVNRGHVYRFLNKPCSVDDLIEVLKDAEVQYKNNQVEHKVLEQTLGGCVKVLTDVLGLVAPFALGRGQRLRDSIIPFAKAINLKSIWVYDVSSVLSAIGYTSLPSSVIRKLESGEELDGKESSLINQMPQIGYDLISDIPKLNPIARAIKYQTKNYDGTGFPNDGVKGQDLPLAARILKVFHDRMTLEREGVAENMAHKMMQERRGKYDPKILELCFKYYPTYLTTSISKDMPVQSLSLDGLKPGQVMVSDLNTVSGVLLVEAGNRLTAATIQRIRNYAVLEQVEGPYYIQQEE